MVDESPDEARVFLIEAGKHEHLVPGHVYEIGGRHSFPRYNGEIEHSLCFAECACGVGNRVIVLFCDARDEHLWYWVFIYLDEGWGRHEKYGSKQF